MESDARVIEAPRGGAACRVCGVPIRSDGAGQRPAYCGRSCSSKAYRQRRREAQDAALGAAVDASRELSTLFGGEELQRIAQLGAVVERAARGLAEELDRGADPMLLRVGLSGLERAAQSLLARARTAVRASDARGINSAAGPLDGSREPSASGADLPVQRPGRPVADPHAGDRQEFAAATREPVGAAELDATREASRIRVGQDPSQFNASREPSSLIRTGSIDASDTDPSGARVLDVRPLAARSLGRPTGAVPLPELGPDWALAGWPDQDTLHVVLHQGRQVGWVEYGADGTDRWIAVAGDRYLVDERTGQPLWHTTARSAARTVMLARRQTIT